MSNVLVTGGAGFIGSFLVDELIKAGHTVTCLDNFFRGKRSNLELVLTHPNFELIEIDLSFTESVDVVRDIILTRKIDMVYHLAAINGTQHFYDHSTMVLQQNVSITMNLMLALSETSVKKIIYTSSSEVYGEPMQVPTSEAHPILLNAEADRDSYAASKALGEFYVRLYAKQYGIDWLVLRVFNMYGPRMVNTKYGQVIPEFIQRILTEDQFTLLGDGRHTRSFCFIKDAARILLLLMQSDAAGFMNLGNPDEISMLELAKRIHQKMDRDFNPVFLPERPNDHYRRCPDISRLSQVVDKLNFTPLDQGLSQVIQYYTDLLPANVS